MNVLLIDGHPGSGHLTSHLTDLYEAALPANAQSTRVALRDLAYEPLTMTAYATAKPWEPDLAALARALDACDHLVIVFPMWWGSEPALVKDTLERILLPHFAFRQHNDDAWWDKLLAGRTADVIITMDTPAWYLKWFYNNALVVRWRKQVLGFCGIERVRVATLSPVRLGGAEKNLPKWAARIAKFAGSIKPAKAAKENHLNAFLAYKGF
ncbi:MAG: NAD(P)H-dependent oxidoreductase [Pseudomonadota bacterium]